MNNFEYKGPYATYRDCFFQVGSYGNGNLAVEVWNNELGPITRVTVNPDIRISKEAIAIKNYSENEGMVDWLISQGIIEDTPIQIIRSGFVEIPVHRLTEHGISEFLS